MWAQTVWLIALHATLPGNPVHGAGNGFEWPEEEDDGFAVTIDDDSEDSEPAEPAARKVQPAQTPVHIPELTSENFNDAIIKNRTAIVKFYWSGHAKCEANIRPFQETAQMFANHDPPVLFAQVEANEQKALTDEFGLNVIFNGRPEMPTFHTFTFGMHQRYFSILKEHTTENVVKKVRQALIDGAKEASLYIMEPGDVGAMERYTNSTLKSEVAIVFRGYKNSAKTRAFKKAVKEWIAPYAEVTKIRSAIVNASKAEAITLTMLRPGFSGLDSSKVEYTGKWDPIAIGRWARKSSYPTISHTFNIDKYGWRAMSELFLEASVVVILGEEPIGLEACKVTDVEGVCANSQSGSQEPLTPKVLTGDEGASQLDGTPGLRSHLTAAVEEVASKYPLWRFVITSAAELGTSERETLGWRNSSEAMVTVLKDKRRYVLDREEELKKPDFLRSFLADVSAGYIAPQWKTEATEEGAPTEVAEGILVLRGDTFEEYALDPTMDVLVLFHHPGCSVCEEVIEPLMRELDKRLEEQLWKTGVALAKFDALNNECLEDVATVPKLVIYPAVDVNRKMKERQVYPGLNDLEPLTEFLVKYSKNIEEAHWFEKKKKKSEKPKEKVLKEKNVPQDRRRRTID